MAVMQAYNVESGWPRGRCLQVDNSPILSITNSSFKSMSRGLLVRVAIDLTAGGWNGPCDKKEFCYVPMGSSLDLSTSYDSQYQSYRSSVEAFLPLSAHRRCHWPLRLPRKGHFDPDFEQLSFGDAGRRGARINSYLSNGDFIVFYAGLRSISSGLLSYSIIGFYIIDQILKGTEVRPDEWYRNAHTRDGGCNSESDIIVYAKPGVSGRLLHHVPIGCYRERAWRVRSDLLLEWGGLDVRDGYIQRSIHLPSFTDPERFKRWFYLQNPELLKANNPV